MHLFGEPSSHQLSSHIFVCCIVFCTSLLCFYLNVQCISRTCAHSRYDDAATPLQATQDGVSGGGGD